MAKAIEIDGIRYCALTIEQIQDNPDLMKALFEKGPDAFSSKERLDKLVQLFTLAAKRNNDIVTEDTVRKTVDMASLPNVIRAVLGQPPIDLQTQTAVSGGASVPTSPQIGGASTPG